MKLTLKAIALTVTALVFSIASAQSEFEIKARAKQYIEMFGYMSDKPLQVERPSDTRWSVYGDNFSVVLNNDLSLRRFQTPKDGEISLNLNFDPDVPYIGDEILLNNARSYLAKLTTNPDLTHVKIEYQPETDTQNRLLRRTRASVCFDTVKSIYALGTGNRTSISMDAQTGELVAIDHSSGYTYQDLDNLISQAQANQVALQNAILPDDTVRNSHLRYAEESAVKGIKESRRCIPIYHVLLESGTIIYVCAKTGEFCKIFPHYGSVARSGGSEDTSKKSEDKTSKESGGKGVSIQSDPNPWVRPTLAISSLGALAGGLTWIFRARLTK